MCNNQQMATVNKYIRSSLSVVVTFFSPWCCSCLSVCLRWDWLLCWRRCSRIGQNNASTSLKGDGGIFNNGFLFHVFIQWFIVTITVACFVLSPVLWGFGKTGRKSGMALARGGAIAAPAVGASMPSSRQHGWKWRIARKIKSWCWWCCGFCCCWLLGKYGGGGGGVVCIANWTLKWTLSEPYWTLTEPYWTLLNPTEPYWTLSEP